MHTRAGPGGGVLNSEQGNPFLPEIFEGALPNMFRALKRLRYVTMHTVWELTLFSLICSARLEEPLATCFFSVAAKCDGASNFGRRAKSLTRRCRV